MKRVMVVDDDPSVLAALRRVLTREFEVETATNGAEALIKFGAFHPDAVLSDLAMPFFDGLELLAEVHRRDAACETVLLSGSPAVPSSDYSVVPKPWDPAKLLGLLRSARAS